MQPASQDASETSSWWPLQILASADSLFRRDGSPQPFSHGNTEVRTPTVITTGQDEVLERMIASLTPDKPVERVAPAPSQATAILGKADKLKVNRSGKSDLMMLAPVEVMKRRTKTPTKFKTSLAVGFDSQDEAVMDSAAKPLSFK